MAWILPTGFNDPYDQWENESEALNLDFGTFAFNQFSGDGKVWGNLDLTFPRVVANKVMIGLSYFPGDGWLSVYSYDGQNYRNILYAHIVSEPAWYTYSFEAHTLEKIRITTYPIGTGFQEVRVHGVAVEKTCAGPLVAICEFLHQVGTFFIDLSLDIVELWLIGGFLATPFEYLGELFYVGADTCCSASGTLKILLDTVAEGITADAILALILENWPTLYYLITDPAGWFLVQLTLAFNLEPWYTQSLEFLSKWVLETYFSTLYQIWLNPEDWFAILLQDRFPTLYYLAVDPTGEILYLIGQVFDLTPWEAQSAEFIVKALFERYFLTLYQLWLDPEDWLVEHVDPRLLAVPVTVAAFLDDPWGWLFDRLEDRIEAYAVRIGEIALEIIARLLGV